MKDFRPMQGKSVETIEDLRMARRWMKNERAARLAKGDYQGFLLLYGSHERLAPFVQHVVPHVHGADYWKLLREVWLMEEVFMPHRKQWVELLHRAEPRRKQFMTVKERQLLSKLPHTLTVYRGFSHAGGEVGFSWTLKQTTARFFADYACGSRRAILTNCMGNEPAIASGSVHKQDVFALLVGRREREIIIGKPESVFNVRVKRLKPSNQNGGQAR